MKKYRQYNETFEKSLNIKEVSDIFHISKSTLRFWENKGLIHPVRNQDNEYREYTRYTITEIEDIIAYKSLGLSLEEIVQLYQSGIENALQSMAGSKKRIEQQKDELDKKLALIRHRENVIREYQRLKADEEYRFCTQGDTPIIRWKWTEKEISPYLMDSYMVIVFYPDEEMHFADGIYAEDDNYNTQDLLWDPKDYNNPVVECLVETDYANPAKNNIAQHLEELHSRGYCTGIVIAQFLTADISTKDNLLHDYFRALIEIIPNAGHEERK